MAEVVAAYRAAKHAGLNPWKAVEAAFSGIPTDVAAEAIVEDDATEAWRKIVERTINGEVIRKRLGAGGLAMTAEPTFQGVATGPETECSMWSGLRRLTSNEITRLAPIGLEPICRRVLGLCALDA